MDNHVDDRSNIPDLARIVRAQRLANSVLLRSVSEQDMFNDMCRGIVEIGGYRMASVGIARDNARHSIDFIAAFGTGTDYLEKVQVTWGDDAHGEGPGGLAIKTGKVQVNQNFRKNASVEAWRELAASYGLASSIALPLKEHEKVFGVLAIYSSEVGAFSDLEIELAADFAEDLSFGITTLRNRDRAAATSEKLNSSLEKTVELLAETMEVRDPYTAGHQRRVADLARAIAVKLGLPNDETHGIYLAGLVHDVGKFNIPTEILVKPSRLSSEELALIKTHSKTGYQLISHVDFPWPIAEIVLQHHERLDGSGYPNGLKGNEICLGARILAVADVMEAMSSHRPYRPGLGLDVALAELGSKRGVLYDAAVVVACVSLFRSNQFQFTGIVDGSQDMRSAQ